MIDLFDKIGLVAIGVVVVAVISLFALCGVVILGISFIGGIRFPSRRASIA